MLHYRMSHLACINECACVRVQVEGGGGYAHSLTQHIYTYTYIHPHTGCLYMLGRGITLIRRKVFAHVWMSHVTYSIESCHVYERVCICARREGIGCERSLTQHSYTFAYIHLYTRYLCVSGGGGGVMMLIWVRNSACPIPKYVMSHLWTSHVPYMNTSCHMYEWVSGFQFIKESPGAPQESKSPFLVSPLFPFYSPLFLFLRFSSFQVLLLVYSRVAVPESGWGTRQEWICHVTSLKKFTSYVWMSVCIC